MSAFGGKADVNQFATGEAFEGIYFGGGVPPRAFAPFKIAASESAVSKILGWRNPAPAQSEKKSKGNLSDPKKLASGRSYVDDATTREAFSAGTGTLQPRN